MVRHIPLLIFFGVLLYGQQLSRAASVTIDFEDRSDSELLTTQYPGLTFTNAIVLTAGISLNEFEFPPHSGMNVVSDNGGPISILFSIPVTSFSAYFTYSLPLSLVAFDGSNAQVASISSQFASNLALSGDPGSSPDELIKLTSAVGISHVLIQGDPMGSSIAADDLTYSSFAIAAVPELSSFFTEIISISCIICIHLLRRQ